MNKYIIIIVSLFWSYFGFTQCGNFTFTSQTELDDFPINHPDCVHLGEVNIKGESIHDLSGLANVESMTALRIDSCGALTVIDGLDNLAVTQALNVRHCPALESITLLGIDSLRYNLDIDNNPRLRSIRLNNLDVVENNIVLRRLEVLTSDSIFLGDIKAVTTFRCEQNPIIEDLIFVNGIREVKQYLQILLNDNLKNLHGLDSLIFAKGVYIKDNNSLLTFEGLESLEVAYQFNIESNNSLISTIGLKSLRQVGAPNYLHGFFALNNLVSLSNLYGLENLREVYGRFAIRTTLKLDDLDPILGLELVTDDLILFENVGLTDISGLDNVDVGQVEELVLEKNFDLEICDSKFVCEYLVSGKPVTIESNGFECRSMEVVKEACLTSSNDSYIDHVFSMYPNPTSGELTVLSTVVSDYWVYTLDGREIAYGEVVDQSIDISLLRDGVYLLKLLIDGQEYYDRVVKY